MRALFWICLLALGYTYAGYPALIWLVSRVARKKVRKAAIQPSVSIILSAFNEEKRIGAKLENLLRLDYPAEKLEILVGSDGASDLTDDVVSRFASERVRFFRFVSQGGKPQVLAELAGEARSEILLFTDARQELDCRAVRLLVRNFTDPSVGAVSGELLFKTESEGVGRGMGFYWEYEKFLRDCESRCGSLLGATGALYAMRRDLFMPVAAGTLVDDMAIPFAVLKHGCRIVFEREARAYDEPSRDGKQEMRRKVRTLAGNYQVFRLFPELFLPWKSPVAWQLVSHKFLRLLAPFFLAGLFWTDLFLNGAGYRFLLILQIVIYALAGLELCRERLGRPGMPHPLARLAALAYTFCLLHVSAVLALAQFVAEPRKATWEKAYA